MHYLIERIVKGSSLALLVLATGCITSPTPSASAVQPQPAVSSTFSSPAATLAADTPSTTHLGTTFLAPAGWSMRRQGNVTVLETPEPGSRVVIVDVMANDAEAALASAWLQLGRMPRTVLSRVPVAPRNGWSRRASVDYVTSPNEHRGVGAVVQHADGLWNVVIEDAAHDVRQKRISQFNTVYSRLLPKDYRRETFAAHKAHKLDAKRIDVLSTFMAQALKDTRVPGAALGIIQDGKVLHAGGFGLRDIHKPDKVDADTRFLIASVTKPLTTLMLGKLVDQKRLAWDTLATSAMPGFKLGDPAMSANLRIKHLICACTGMPRRDYEWLLEYEDATAQTAIHSLADVRPTSGFGELYQYSNPMAAAAGFLGGHVAHPGLELGAAYDKAMRELVFDPLGMSRTTFDFDVAEKGNFAAPHAPDFTGRVSLVHPRINRSAFHVRPAAAAWSSVNDLLKYVAMELSEGVLPDGSRYIARNVLQDRSTPQVKMNPDASYGMGLRISTDFGTPVVWHDGFMFGFHSVAMWLPEHGVGAVVLTNGAPGWHIHAAFQRKLLEVLFDGRPEADEGLSVRTQAYDQSIEQDRKRIVFPAEASVVQSLAKHYRHPAVGSVRVVTTNDGPGLDFGEWSSAMGSVKNPDGTHSLMTVGPAVLGFEFLVGNKDGKRTLLLRDAQNRYELVEVP